MFLQIRISTAPLDDDILLKNVTDFKLQNFTEGDQELYRYSDFKKAIATLQEKQKNYREEEGLAVAIESVCGLGIAYIFELQRQGKQLIDFGFIHQLKIFEESKGWFENLE